MKLPIGIEDFAEIRLKDYHFIDKSLFIKNLIDKSPKVLLMTRPRRFGKTLLMSMVRYFFSLDNREENRHLFDGLQIEKLGSSYMQEQGQRPVIMLSLKDCKATSWTLMQAKLKNRIASIYRQYRFLLDDERLMESDRRYFNAVLNEEASQVALENALQQLLQMLQQHYQKPVVLLLDEYDVPIQQAWEQGFYTDAIAFMRNFLSAALKTNPSLDFALLTGVLRIAKESIFSGLNNLIISSVIEESYPTAMGFTVDEVHALAEAMGVSHKLPEIKQWYDGYHFAGTEIYNPWSVLNYFDNNCRPQPYWANTSSNTILKQLLKNTSREQQNNLLRLLRGQSIAAIIDEGIVYEDIGSQVDALYTIMLTTGYLTSESISWGPAGQECTLTIPNEEIRGIYSREVLRHISGGESTSVLTRLMRNLLSGNAELFQQDLQNILLQMTSVYDTANKESFYHGFLLGMTALLVPQYEVQSNRESGEGRFDLAIFPKDKANFGAILEFKTAATEDELSGRAKEALQQIEGKEYMQAFVSRGIPQSHVFQYGISFCGKKVEIMM
ncbi:AAA family ATPase [Selenomonas sp. KH1T6]|uniref:AAA family ATPase n=1 Tax=Selenomonas sp. KH1T6 TaxID=3158784 RepID=UPI0008A78CFB|nr:PD-(D/E)XK nuclease superfamily protein [Selenomonas ruminantium]